MRSFLIALLILLWLILGWLYYQDYNNCCTGKNEVAAAPVLTEKTGPILFNWGDKNPILGEGWPRMRDSLALFATDSTKLEITGLYCENSAPDETDSTGLARAAETKKLFTNVPPERIVIVSRAVPCDSTHRISKFESVSFAKRIHTENIKEVNEKTLIYFPFNSTKKLNNTEIESYLRDVADRVKKSGETIQLSGHTDAIGSVESNLTLGQQRADIVKNYLLSQGVSKDKIVSTSQGESSPVADNDSESGRAKNRRTELTIIR